MSISGKQSAPSLDYPPARVPDRPSYANLREAVQTCRACDLWEGAAAQALLGSHVRIGRDRGRPIDSGLAELVTITTHPTAILRAEENERDEAMDAFVADLTNVASWLSER